MKKGTVLSIVGFLLSIILIGFCWRNLQGINEDKERLQIIACGAGHMIEGVPNTIYLVYCEDSSGNIIIRSIK
jgi:hypothetical protein